MTTARRSPRLASSGARCSHPESPQPRLSGPAPTRGVAQRTEPGQPAPRRGDRSTARAAAQGSALRGEPPPRVVPPPARRRPRRSRSPERRRRTGRGAAKAAATSAATATSPPGPTSSPCWRRGSRCGAGPGRDRGSTRPRELGADARSRRSPHEDAETTELFSALREAIDEELSPHQREVSRRHARRRAHRRSRRAAEHHARSALQDHPRRAAQASRRTRRRGLADGDRRIHRHDQVGTTRAVTLLARLVGPGTRADLRGALRAAGSLRRAGARRRRRRRRRTGNAGPSRGVPRVRRGPREPADLRDAAARRRSVGLGRRKLLGAAVTVRSVRGLRGRLHREQQVARGHGLGHVDQLSARSPGMGAEQLEGLAARRANSAPS